MKPGNDSDGLFKEREAERPVPEYEREAEALRRKIYKLRELRLARDAERRP